MRVIIALFAGLAFLLGSFPSGLVLAKAVTGRDIRRYGSGNIGASNVTASAGRGIGVAVAALDMLKGVVPLLIARLAAVSPTGMAIVALAAVLGHNFSIFLRFRGGKGVATSLGVSLVLSPIAAALSMLTWVAMVSILRYASAASLAALAALPVYMALTHQDRAYVVFGIILVALAAAKHWENIVKLLQGKEPKVGQPARPRV
jgi:glycerol-3-phosphate acyltransferase PlsY